MASLNRHFNGVDPEAFGRRIRPTEADESRLRSAAEKIRDVLRVVIYNLTKQELGPANAVYPKFRLQGSWSYRTCNRPCHVPPQQMDYDYGVYLPIKVWDEKNPKLAAATYFAVVDQALIVLCKGQRWNLDRENPNCSRVIIGPDAHLDVPLYAVPDDEFSRLIEARVLKTGIRPRTLDEEEVAFAEFDWTDIDTIVMATRDGVWKPSDIRLIQIWFADMIQRHGPQLRRICCYLKAWRDNIWPCGGPSSIALMICICAPNSFEGSESRDDLALYKVLKALPNQLLAKIECHPVGGDEDFNKLDLSGRQEAYQRAIEFRDALGSLIAANTVSAADLMRLTDHLGDRFPVRAEWAEANAVAAIVTSTPARQTERPNIVSTSGG